METYALEEVFLNLLERLGLLQTVATDVERQIIDIDEHLNRIQVAW